MTIEYLKTYEEKKDDFKDGKTEPKFKVKPCTMEEIESLEQDLNEGKPFPKAFREYLYIGGQWTGLPLQVIYRGMKEWTEFVKEKMPKRGIKMDRPIAVIHHHEGYAFTFIYLDEGDNPQPWNCSTEEGYDSDDDEIIWKTPFETFKDNIDFMVELAVKGIGL